MNAPTTPDLLKSASLIASGPIASPALSGGKRARKVPVIGAGITGVTVAYALARRGLDVTVFDRHRYPAMETSFANGGQLSASNAEVWNHPGNLVKCIKWMFKADAPLLFNLKPSWHKYSWIAQFLADMRHHEANTVRSAELAIMARANLDEWAREENIDFNHERRGILHIYRSDKSVKHARKVGGMLARAVLDRREVARDEVRQIEPTLTGSYAGAFFTPSDTTGDIHQYTVGLAQACQRRGVTFLQGVDVKQVSARSGIAVRFVQNVQG